MKIEYNIRVLSGNTPGVKYDTTFFQHATNTHYLEKYYLYLFFFYIVQSFYVFILSIHIIALKLIVNFNFQITTIFFLNYRNPVAFLG